MLLDRQKYLQFIIATNSNHSPFWFPEEVLLCDWFSERLFELIKIICEISNLCYSIFLESFSIVVSAPRVSIVLLYDKFVFWDPLACLSCRGDAENQAIKYSSCYLNIRNRLAGCGGHGMQFMPPGVLEYLSNTHQIATRSFI